MNAGIRAQDATDKLLANIDVVPNKAWKPCNNGPSDAEPPLSNPKWPRICKAHKPQNPGIEPTGKVVSQKYQETINWEINQLIAQSDNWFLAGLPNCCGTLVVKSQAHHSMSASQAQVPAHKNVHISKHQEYSKEEDTTRPKEAQKLIVPLVEYKDEEGIPFSMLTLS